MSKADSKLLQQAARAAGIEVWPGDGWQGDKLFTRPRKADTSGVVCGVEWDPLNDDGDALRLAADLRLSICHHHEDDSPAVTVMVPIGWHRFFSENHEAHGQDARAATRRAIVRAAAAIGAAMDGSDGRELMEGSDG